MMKIARTLGTVHTHTHTPVFYKIKKYTRIRKNTLLLFALLAAILLMGIGYASINSITGEIQGTVTADAYEGLIITEVKCIDSSNATGNIDNTFKTTMNSSIELSNTDINSYITYEITIRNNTKFKYKFKEVITDEQFYLNSSGEFNLDIIYELDGRQENVVLNPYESITFGIKFKYADGVDTNTLDNTLISYLNFSFEGTLIVAWDVSTTKDNSILAYAYDDDFDELYEIYIETQENASSEATLVLQNKFINSTNYFLNSDKITRGEIENISFLNEVKANKNSQSLFCSLINAKNIDNINYLDTCNVTNMTYMFAYMNQLENLDLSTFDTKNVADMGRMFGGCTSLKKINLSSFETGNVTNMSYMFEKCRSLTELNLDTFDTSKVSNMSNMFNEIGSVTTLDVKKFNTSQVKDMSNMFAKCSSLETLDLSNFNTENVTKLGGIFIQCGKIARLDLTSFNTKNVTVMRSMFQQCSALTELDISSFNTENVTEMGSMFDRCISLKSMDLSNFNTSQVTTMGSMFNGCSGLTTLDLSNFNTSQVTNMSNMFQSCSGLTTLNITNFNTSQVKSMDYMFQNCKELTTLDVSNFNTSQVTSMSYMFAGCSRLTTLNLTNFDTSQVTGMAGMFNGDSGLTTLNITNFNTSQVTTMSNMFQNCKGLTALNVSNLNTSQVTSMSYMFAGCSELIVLNLNNFDTSQVTDMVFMFAKCSKLTILNISSFNTNQVTDMNNMFKDCSELTTLDVSNFNTSQVTSMSYMFNGCSGLASLDVSNFDTSQVTSMSYMFNGCSGLTELNISNFNTSQVTTMVSMLRGCSGLTTLDLSDFNTSQVKNMYYMFQNCKGLTSLDLSNFNTSQVTSMSYMFAGCSELIVLNLNNFDTSQVTNMASMFNGCSKLTTIYAKKFDESTNTGWTTSAVTNSTNMFIACNSITGGNGTKYNSSYIDATYARIDTAETPGYFTNIEDKKSAKPSELFDADGTNAEGLHIGDFVNYDAGKWTQDEINAIQVGLKTSLVTANGSTDLPNEAFQFGGFTEGSSRNGNATAPDRDVAGLGDYLKDKATGDALTGWRVLDVDGDNVTLISAGNPEDYYVSDNSNGFNSEYVLTGNVNSGWNTTEADNYQKRDWNKYVNTLQKGESATVLTKSKLDSWYSKYLEADADTSINETFAKIFQEPYTKYINMIKNNSYQWFGDAYSNDYLYNLYPSYDSYVTYDNNSSAMGVRILVTLSSNVLFTAKKTGTKTVTGEKIDQFGGEQTYNCWEIR